MSFELNLTEKAAEYFKNRMSWGAQGVRIAVKTSGCSGFQYEPPEKVLKGADISADHAIEHHGVTLYVDPKSAAYLNGATVDIVKEGLNEMIRVSDNPNAAVDCGCGESFSPVEGFDAEPLYPEP